MKTDVTVVGLGPMGAALARTLIGAGRSITVWNRTSGRSRALAAEGASAPAALCDAVAASPVIVLVVRGYDVATALLDSCREQLAGRTIVQLSSGTPDDAIALERLARRSAAGYLDGIIHVLPRQIGTDEAAITYAGPVSTVDAVRAVLSPLAPTQLHAGEEIHLAAVRALCDNITGYSMMLGFLQGAAIAAAYGMPPRALLDQGRDVALPSLGTALEHLVATLESGELSGAETPLGGDHEALEHVLRCSSELGLATTWPRAAVELLEAAIGQAGETGDLAAVFGVLGGRVPGA